MPHDRQADRPDPLGWLCHCPRSTKTLQSHPHVRWLTARICGNERPSRNGIHETRVDTTRASSECRTECEHKNLPQCPFDNATKEKVLKLTPLNRGFHTTHHNDTPPRMYRESPRHTHGCHQCQSPTRAAGVHEPIGDATLQGCTWQHERSYLPSASPF